MMLGCAFATKGITVFDSLSKVMIFSSMLTTCASAMVLEVQSNTASKTRIRFMVLGEGSEQRKEQLLLYMGIKFAGAIFLQSRRFHRTI
jgi:hypothetical protein